MVELKVGTRVYIKNTRGYSRAAVLSTWYEYPVKFCRVTLVDTLVRRELVISKKGILIRNKNRIFHYEV